MISIIVPMDANRLEQFAVTKRLYDAMDVPHEIIIPTRSRKDVHKYLSEHKLMKNVRFVSYVTEAGFNPSKAFNLGVKSAKYDSIIITSPEVRPETDVLPQLSECIGQNVVCQVFDEGPDGQIAAVLVNSTYRHENPGFYFLAMYNKKDIEVINGWDEEFMKGYAYEDDDFGERWVRAGLPFTFRDDIRAVHQYHPRSETIPSGAQINQAHLFENRSKGIVKCTNGLEKLSL
jgi:GT2 family glycosyltransferase